MKKIKIHCDSGLPLDLDIRNERQIELYVDDLNIFNDNSDSIKILVLVEPEEIKPFADQVIQNHKKVDFILTHNEKILNACDNAHLFEYGTTWIKDYKFPEKNFSISHLVGFKTWTKGHRLRQKIWYKQSKIKNPINFYISKFNQGIDNFANAPILEGDKDPLFDSQFHITIENTYEKNFFSEKVMDAFLTKTVPVYWGCPNIGDYFNLDGMLIVEDMKDLFKKVNGLTPEIYESMTYAIEDNYHRAQEFAEISPRMERLLKRIIDEETTSWMRG